MSAQPRGGALARGLLRLTEIVTRAPAGSLTSLWGTGFGGLLPLSHGYVHEAYSGAWQMNYADRACDPLAFSAVYACANIISSDLAKLRLSLWRINTKDGKPNGREPADNHPLQAVLWHPNHYQTRVEFFVQFVLSYLLTGNAYVFLEYDARYVVKAMYVLNPRRVRPAIDESGEVWYELDTNPLAGIPDRTYVPARFILHHRIMTVSHPLIGVTPLYAAAISAATGMCINENSRAFFSNMSRASGVLKSPHKISKELADRLRVEWEQNFKAGSIGRTAVLGEGLEWQALTMNAADAQLIEQLRWSVEDVARCFRVPGYMLGDTTKATFRNAEAMGRNYLTAALGYHIEAIEASFDKALQLPDDIWVKFDLSQLLRTEFDVRVNAMSKGIAAGIYTINEARTLEELPRVEGGDEPLVQMQYRPLSAVLEDPGGTNAPPPPDAPDTADDAADGEDSADTPDDSLTGEEMFDAARVRTLIGRRLRGVPRRGMPA